MRSKLKLVVNNKFKKKEKFFVKNELRSILNLYAKKVSAGDWKDYGLSINKKEISFDIYQRASEKPIYRISKNLSPKRQDERFYILDRNVRMDTMLGIVGAGGIGYELQSSFRMFEYERVSAIIILIFGTIFVIDKISSYLRERLL